ncbi:MAG: nucleotide exchange factor GrpE [Planctomycetes bacterium]|nr:nucleotide exchange factor GrpE [Planctomycetota bacterium]
MEEGKKTKENGDADSPEESPEETNAVDAGVEPTDDDVDQPEATDRVQARLEEAYGKRDELQNKYLRAAAELENLRKRSAREREEITSRTRANVIGDLLPTVDAFRLGLEDAQSREEAKGVVEGFAMVMTQLETILGEHGLLPIDPAGEPFDHNLHEAVAREKSDEVEEGVVLSTVRVGYKLGGRLLRPAAVVISKGDDDEEEANEEEG